MQEQNFLLYTSQSGDVKLQVIIENDSLWLTQAKIAELFSVTPQNVTLHLKNIYESWELSQEQTCKDFLQVQKEWEKEVKRNLKFYNLDAIISVWYRVNSARATQFRIWATSVLREYIIKGFVMDDERLKQGKTAFWMDYFRELLERVRSIRASERRVYLQITDIFSECSCDYDPQSQTTKDFFASVQNKFHYAITWKTAAEIISQSADKTKKHMGLSTWKHAPKGRILQSDVTVAKNYLSEADIKKLERTISSFFDYIENQIENHNSFTMEEFSHAVDKFLSFNDFQVLGDKGKISKSQADKKALEEYSEYNKQQQLESDFEKHMKKMLSNRWVRP